MLTRNTAMTHLVDADQRTVELPVVSRTGGTVTVAVTDNAAVLPDGPYVLFANKQYEQGETPSVGRQVFVGQVPDRFADDIAANNAATVGEELAARGQAGSNGSKSGTATTTATTGDAPAAAAPVADAASAVTTTVAAAAPVNATLRASSLPLTGVSTPVTALGVAALGAAGVLLWRRRQPVPVRSQAIGSSTRS